MNTSQIELKNLITDSTIHGIPRLLKTKSFFMKIVWGIFTAASVVLCVHQIKQSVEDFLSYDTVTTFETIVEIPAKFPTITICNLNIFQNNFNYTIINTVKLPPNITFNKVDERFFLLNNLHPLNDTIKKKFAFSIEEMLISCRFNGQFCDWSDFEWYFDPFYANCYRFNSKMDQIKIVTQSGNLFGLRLELFMGDEFKMQSLMRTAGFQIMINNQSNYPSINEGYTVAPGIETNLEVSRVFNQKLGPPHSNCIQEPSYLDGTTNSHLHQAIVESNQSYRQNDCFKLCLQQEIINKCGCYSNLFGKLNSTNSCQSSENNNCMVSITKLFFEGNVLKTCLPYCPSECDTQSFSVSISSSLYPIHSYALELMNNSIINSKFLNESISPEKVKNSVLSVNVSYKDLSFIVIGQQPKLILPDLVSNVGGILGVFIGMSLLSLVEIIEILLQVYLSIKFHINRTNDL